MQELKKLSILVDKDVHKSLKHKALMEDTTLTEVIGKLIDDYLNDSDDKEVE